MYITFSITKFTIIGFLRGNGAGEGVVPRNMPGLKGACGAKSMSKWKLRNHVHRFKMFELLTCSATELIGGPSEAFATFMLTKTDFALAFSPCDAEG